MISHNKFGSQGYLGNQLFQYSLLFSLSKKYGYTVGLLDGGFQFWNCFDIVDPYGKMMKISSPPIDNIVFQERFGSFNFDPLVFELGDNTSYIGFYQSYKYFDEYRQDLICSLKFKDEIIEKSEKILTELPLNNKNNMISLHVRRNDYTVDPKIWGDLLGSGYYEESLSLFSKDRDVLVFSEDTDYMKNYFKGSRFHVIERKGGIYDEESLISLYLMSLCKDHIIGNSSFSWWGAYLSGNEKIVCPFPWLPSTHPAPNNIQKDITKEEWLRVPIQNW